MDFRKILTDSGVSLVRKVVAMARGVLIVPIITKQMGVDAYGVWAVVFSLITLFSAVGSLHLHGVLIRYTPAETRRGQTLSDLLGIAVLTATLAGGVLFLSTRLALSLTATPVWGIGLPVAATLVVVAKILGLLLKNIPRSEERVKKYELVVLVEMTLQTTLLVATLLVTGNLVAGLLAVFVSILLTDIGLSLVYLPSRVQRPAPGNYRRYFSYCTPMVLKEMSNKLLSESDRFLILFFLSPVQVGIYSVVYGVSLLLPNLTFVFNSTLYPSMTSAWENDELDEIEQFYQNFIKGYVVFVIPALFGLTLLADPLLRLLATPTVAEEGWLLVPVLTAAFAFRALENVLTYVLNAAEDTDKVAVGTTLALVSNLVLNLALIPVIGLLGAAIAMVGGMAVRLLYVYWKVSDYISIPVPVATFGKALLSSLVMSAILVSVVLHPDHPVFRLVSYPLLGAAVYLVTVYLSGGITQRDISKLRSLL